MKMGKPRLEDFPKCKVCGKYQPGTSIFFPKIINGGPDLTNLCRCEPESEVICKFYKDKQCIFDSLTNNCFLECNLDKYPCSFNEVEKLAKALHEAGREAVEKRKVLVKNPKFAKFLEWDEITEDAKEGRRIQARFLSKKYIILKKQPP